MAGFGGGSEHPYTPSNSGSLRVRAVKNDL